MTAKSKIIAVRFQQIAFAAKLLEMSNSVWSFTSVPLIWMYFADFADTYHLVYLFFLAIQLTCSQQFVLQLTS